jgi:hypothetical protein
MEQLKLPNKWEFYLHLHDNNSWSIDSYLKMIDITCVKDAILLNDEITYDLIKKTMIFFMKSPILPMWEDEQNKNGGCFSFKVVNKDIEQVWKDIYFHLISNSITKDVNDNDKINGITLSPKKKFCILKIWMKDCLLTSPNIFIPILNLTPESCIFKKHCQ